MPCQPAWVRELTRARSYGLVPESYLLGSYGQQQQFSVLGVARPDGVVIWDSFGSCTGNNKRGRDPVLHTIISAYLLCMERYRSFLLLMLLLHESVEES